MRRATEDHVVEVKDGAKKTRLEGGELTNFLMALAEYVERFAKLEKRLGDSRPLDAMLEVELGRKMELEDKKKLDAIAQELQSQGFKTNVQLDEEHNLFTLTFSNETPGEQVIDWELVSSADYRRLLELHRRVRNFDKPPFVLSANGSQMTIENREQLLEHVMAVGKKAFTVQRFKGLGEMNPTQLWETTMDAEQRTLLQVRVEDQVEADSIFTVLMGDAVDPRRQFIQDNALDVKNLDI
jgi:DNA gyrase subunit B